MNQHNMPHAQLPPGAMNTLMNLVQSQPQPQHGSQNHTQIQGQPQQQHAQAAVPALLPAGWQPQAVPVGNAGAQVGPWHPSAQLLMHLMAQQSSFPAVPAHHPSANEIAAAVAAAIQPLIREKNAAPVGSAANDEQILVDALKKAKADGLTPRQALEKLHGVNDHTETGWKNYFLDHYERLHARVYTRSLVEVMASRPTSSASLTRAARFPAQHHRNESQQEIQSSPRPPNLAKSFSDKVSTSTRHKLVEEREVPRTEGSRKPIYSRRDAGAATRRKPETSESGSSEYESSDEEDENQEEDDNIQPIRAKPLQRQQARHKPSTTTGTLRSKRKSQNRTGPGKRVTEEILRAMAIYMVEKADEWDSLGSQQARWAEFAARAENTPPNGRSLGAWAQVARDHAEDLSRHIDEYTCEQSLAKLADEQQATPPRPDRDADASIAEGEGRPSRAMLKKRRAESSASELLSAETSKRIKQEQEEPDYIVLSE
ncbi:hypothetical protein C8Q80DRAFT_1153843 [Daedaleopsis nitida]|nr:hypothetical protein C8Q80DRAFT_1153843 [Daedaleopsis nitida]